MRVQNNVNQQSFQARAWFKSPAVPENFRKLITHKPKEATHLANLDLTTHVDANCVVDNLIFAAKRGEITRSKKIIIPQAPFTEARVFELSGDTVVLYSKPSKFPKSKQLLAKVDIEHGEDGNKGITQIFKCKYFPIAKDPVFDTLARTLNELPEL